MTHDKVHVTRIKVHVTVFIHMTRDKVHVTHVATAPEAAACVGDVAGMVPGAAPRARALAARVGHLRSDYLDYIYLVLESRYLFSV